MPQMCILFFNQSTIFHALHCNLCAPQCNRNAIQGTGKWNSIVKEQEEGYCVQILQQEPKALIFVWDAVTISLIEMGLNKLCLRHN